MRTYQGENKMWQKNHDASVENQDSGKMKLTLQSIN